MEGFDFENDFYENIQNQFQNLVPDSFIGNKRLKTGNIFIQKRFIIWSSNRFCGLVLGSFGVIFSEINPADGKEK